VLSVLQKHGLSINLSKCQLAQTQVNFLSYTINEHGIKPPSFRINVILNYDRPETISQLGRFLGVINYYRRCLPRSSHIQAPLSELLRNVKKNDQRQILWTTELISAFENCKQSIADAALLSFPAPKSDPQLVCDASDLAIGAVLEQRTGNDWQPLGFFSKKLSNTERNYSTYDRKLLAIHESIKYFRHLVGARNFVIKTDHKPLVFAFQQRPEKASPRQLRHLNYISLFSTTILHIKGTENIVADAFSRLCTITMPTAITAAQLEEEQASDSELARVLQGTTSLKLKKVCFGGESSIYCDVSTPNFRPFVPQSLRKQAFSYIHNLSHPSGRATAHQIKQKFVWPSMNKDVLKWCRLCLPCQRSKIHKHNHLQPEKIAVPNGRFDHVHLDIVVMPLQLNYRYCLTMIDRFSRWPEAVPLSNITADTIATAFWTHWISRFGSPKTITTDQGTQFESAVFKQLANLIGSKHFHTTAYHPQSNGLIERWHRSFKSSLMCSSGTPWPQLLPTVLLGLRTCFKEDIKSSAAEMIYGVPIRLPNEFFTNMDETVNPTTFLSSFREHMQNIRPTPTAHHIKKKCSY
jgi:cleavage and polyadenylation specificity factor subunit 1